MKKRLICILISIILFFTVIFFRIIVNYESSCDLFVENAIKGDITKEINKIIYKKFNTLESNDFRNIVLKTDGNIGRIEINSSAINLLCNEISTEIYNMINNSKHKYGMPIGNTFGTSYLSGIGPEIGVTIIPKGYVEYKTSSELLSGGINQSLYKINADFKVVIQCLAPFDESIIEISVPLIISETLIIGNIPEILFTP